MNIVVYDTNLQPFTVVDLPFSVERLTKSGINIISIPFANKIHEMAHHMDIYFSWESLAPQTIEFYFAAFSSNGKTSYFLVLINQEDKWNVQRYLNDKNVSGFYLREGRCEVIEE